MASRLALPKIPRIAIDVDPRDWVEVGRRGLAWRPPRGTALRRALWRGGTFPYWFGSDVPAPQLPARDSDAPPAGLAGDQVSRLIDQIARRVWIQRALTIVARSAWLGLLVGCLWLLLELQGGPDLDAGILIWIAAVIALPGLVFAALVRPTRVQVARMLDRSFGLQERMSTAVENLGKGVPKDGERARLIYLQMADAANVVAELRRFHGFAIRLPVRELVMAIVCALFFAALFFMRGVGGDIPPVQAGAVPPFTPASERIAQQPPTTSPAGAQADAPTVKEVEERAQRSQETRQDLQQLAQALSDHGMTSAAAEAIQSGDYQAAANALRDAAEDADKLSPAARENLAQDLDTAASRMSEGGQSLADASRQAADGLRQGEQAAQDGVRNLGDAVEKAGSEVASQEELADQMQQAQQAQQAEQNSGSSEASQSQSSDQSGEQSSSEGSDQTGSKDDGSQAGAEGEGSQAEPGEGSQSSEPGQNEGNPESAADASGEQAQPGENGEPGQPGQPGGAQQPGEEGAGQPGSEGQPGENGQQPSAADQGEGANQGDGAGSSGGEGEAQPGQVPGATDGQQPAEGEPPAANVAEGNGDGGGGQTDGEAPDPREAITLNRSQQQGESVTTSVDNGGSSVGAGYGSSVTTGTSTQGEVGAAGPDSNRVPPDYRSIVEDYFSNPEGS